MNILGVNMGEIVNVVTGPVGAIGAIATGVVFTKIWDFIKKRRNPLNLIREAIGVIKLAILEVDNRVIDKFLPNALKNAIQNDLKKELIRAGNELIALAEEISD